MQWIFVVVVELDVAVSSLENPQKPNGQYVTNNVAGRGGGVRRSRPTEPNRELLEPADSFQLVHMYYLGLLPTGAFNHVRYVI